MTKQEFIQLVQSSGNYDTKIEVERAINAFTDAITTALVNRDEVSISGFGSFGTAFQKGKSGKVPGSDKTYTTEDKMIPKFKAFGTFKEKVASGKQ